MSLISTCQNHPNALTIDNCTRCKAALCGMCVSFVGDKVFCESCVKTHEAKKIVSSQNKGNHPSNNIFLDNPYEEEYEIRKKRNSNGKSLIWLVIVICSIAVYAQLYFYTHPTETPIDQQQLATNQRLVSIIQCLNVFHKVGQILTIGEMPDSQLKCEDPSGPLVITTDGDTISISHANPSIYGVSQISVSNDNPFPILLD
ncbi:MAG TPA: hypothetical protein EYG31_05730 [Porticoccaceae bacterium]|nr:hypothetical protein [Gammaproteobacteria bacterium]HIL60117.1 hypothetical protein [Porticoccaceae bacterium]